jgi:hypothetical protein
LVYQSINNGENDNWLLIFDNVDNFDIISDYVPYYGSGSVLITSQDPITKEPFFSNTAKIQLEPLSTADSATLLRKLIANAEVAQSPDEQNASVELVNHLNGLPLAITQMAGFIRRRHLSIRELVNLYTTDAQHTEIYDLGNPIQEHRHGYTFATTYNFQGLSLNATKLLQLLAFMNLDRVQEYIFVNPQASEKGYPCWTASLFESARHELLASSIIRQNIHKKELWIHGIIQEVVRNGIDNALRYQTFKDVVSLLAEVWPLGDDFSQQIKRWALCEDLLPHLEQFYQLYMKYSAAWDLFEVDPTFPALLNKAAV